MPYPAKEYLDAYMIYRGALLDLLEKLPADKANFAPWQGSRTILGLLDHISDTSEALTGIAAGKTSQAAPPRAIWPPPKQGCSRAPRPFKG